jgi:hypothetical protein
VTSLIVAAALLAATPEAQPKDFIDDARLLFRVVACTGEEPLPEGLDAKVLEPYCKTQLDRMAKYREHWGSVARDFLTALRPAGLPTTVVYPFGGGDLLSALTTYPDAAEVTTLSLELAGDPRRLRGLKDSKKLAANLAALLEATKSTWVSNDGKSVNLSKLQKGELPGQLSFHLLGLATQGQRPVSVKYFRIEPDGALHYLTEADIAALEATKAAKLKSEWASPDFSPAFANVEIAFVAKDAPAGATPRVHRHIGANLADDALAAHPELLKHLEAKGKVCAMTKAASYLLWRNDFNAMRKYLLEHMEYMVSDSTGIPPDYVKKAGFVQETYGSFEKSFLTAPRDFNQQLVKLFASQPARKLPFRYGYPDGSDQRRSHLVITKRAGP